MKIASATVRGCRGSSDWPVAAVVMVCSLALAAALYCALNGNPFQSGARCLVEFEDGQGLSRNSPVFFAGVPVGRVTDVGLGRMGSGPDAVLRVEATLELEDLDQFPAMVEARVESASLLGDRRVVLFVPPGCEPGKERLQPGQRVRGHSGRGQLSQLVGEQTWAGLEVMMSNLTAISEALKEQVTLGSGDPAMTGSSNLLTSVLSVLQSLRALPVREFSDKVMVGVEHAKSVLAKADGFPMAAISTNVLVTLTNLAETTAELRALVGKSPANTVDEALAERVMRLLAKSDSAVAELRANLVLAQYFTEKVSREPHRMIFGKSGADPTRPSKVAVMGVVGSRTNPVDAAAFRKIDGERAPGGSRRDSK